MRADSTHWCQPNCYETITRTTMWGYAVELLLPSASKILYWEVGKCIKFWCMLVQFLQTKVSVEQKQELCRAVWNCVVSVIFLLTVELVVSTGIDVTTWIYSSCFESSKYHKPAQVTSYSGLNHVSYCCSFIIVWLTWVESACVCQNMMQQEFTKHLLHNKFLNYGLLALIRV